MPSDSATLVLHCRFALELTQKELGALLGVNRRTIQRWQRGSANLDLDQAKTLAKALRPGFPELADAVMDHARYLGALSRLVASPEAIAAILRAAAMAGGTSADTARAIVMAAFASAADEGVDVRAVLAAMSAG
jgi:transcriptional regulator with XRE-family HTH domain